MKTLAAFAALMIIASVMSWALAAGILIGVAFQIIATIIQILTSRTL